MHASALAQSMRQTAIILALATLAGCFAPPPTDAQDGSEPVDGEHTMIEIVATGCQIGALAFLVDPAHAQEHVPEWAIATDAQNVLGTPAPLNRGFMLVEVYRCRSHTFANDSEIEVIEVSVAIEAPDVPGEREAAAFDWFQPIYGASANAHAALRTIHWDHFDMKVTSLDITALPTTSSIATWEAGNESGPIVTARVVGPGPVTIGGINRFWQVHEEGTSYIDYDIEVSAGGGAAECTIASPVADAIGLARCTPGEAIGMVAPAIEFTALAHYLPGIQPNAPGEEAK